MTNDKRKLLKLIKSQYQINKIMKLEYTKNEYNLVNATIKLFEISIKEMD